MVVSTIPLRKGLRSILGFIAISVLLSNIANAQLFDWAPKFPVGSSIPLLEAPDQNGNQQTLSSLTGDVGLVLVFNRSFDWCPFCKAQLKTLTDVTQEFRDLGFGIATITYDSPDILKLAEADFSVGFTLLQDVNRKHVDAFDILNKDYSPGDFAYGVPQPGIMLIDSDGVIQVKFSEENFRTRPDWSDVLEAARSMAKPQN